MNLIKGCSQTLPRVLVVMVMGDTLQANTLHHLEHIHHSLTVILHPDILLKATLPKVDTLHPGILHPGILPKVDTLHLGTLPRVGILLQVLIMVAMVRITQEAQMLEPCWLVELQQLPRLMEHTT